MKEKSKVEVTSSQSHIRLTATVDDFQHDKIPAVQIRLKREAQAQRKVLKKEGHLNGRPEIALCQHALDYIHTCFKFIRVSTVMRDFRSAYKKKFSLADLLYRVDVFASADVPCHRKFTGDQVESRKDRCSGALTDDKVSIFSLRPRQLVSVDNIRSI